jgi:hypothetical protein
MAGKRLNVDPVEPARSYRRSRRSRRSRFEVISGRVIPFEKTSKNDKSRAKGKRTEGRMKVIKLTNKEVTERTFEMQSKWLPKQKEREREKTKVMRHWTQIE